MHADADCSTSQIHGDGNSTDASTFTAAEIGSGQHLGRWMRYTTQHSNAYAECLGRYEKNGRGWARLGVDQGSARDGMRSAWAVVE
jgi:hypothetical protein